MANPYEIAGYGSTSFENGYPYFLDTIKFDGFESNLSFPIGNMTLNNVVNQVELPSFYQTGFHSMVPTIPSMDKARRGGSGEFDFIQKQPVFLMENQQYYPVETYYNEFQYQPPLVGDSIPFPGSVLLPIQAPYDESYRYPYGDPPYIPMHQYEIRESAEKLWKEIEFEANMVYEMKYHKDLAMEQNSCNMKEMKVEEDEYVNGGYMSDETVTSEYRNPAPVDLFSNI